MNTMCVYIIGYLYQNMVVDRKGKGVYSSRSPPCSISPLPVTRHSLDFGHGLPDVLR